MPQRHNVSDKKIVYRGAHQWAILRIHVNFQLSRYYGLSCGSDTEIETPKALRSILRDYVTVGTVRVHHILLTTSYSESAYCLPYIVVENMCLRLFWNVNIFCLHIFI